MIINLVIFQLKGRKLEVIWIGFVLFVLRREELIIIFDVNNEIYIVLKLV